MTSAVTISVIGNEIGQLIVGEPASKNKVKISFKQTSLLLRAKADIWQG